MLAPTFACKPEPEPFPGSSAAGGEEKLLVFCSSATFPAPRLPRGAVRKTHPGIPHPIRAPGHSGAQFPTAGCPPFRARGGHPLPGPVGRGHLQRGERRSVGKLLGAHEPTGNAPSWRRMAGRKRSKGPREMLPCCTQRLYRPFSSPTLTFSIRTILADVACGSLCPARPPNGTISPCGLDSPPPKKISQIQPACPYLQTLTQCSTRRRITQSREIAFLKTVPHCRVVCLILGRAHPTDRCIKGRPC